MLMFRLLLLMIVYVQLFRSNVVLRMSFLFYFEIEGFHPSEGAG